MFNLDAVKGQAKKFNTDLVTEGMTFQSQVVDNRAAPKKKKKLEKGKPTKALTKLFDVAYK